MSDITGQVFNIQHFSTEDGPGIRTTVFLKGCPLNCLWCANPESKKHFRQLAHRSSVCIHCGCCIKACPVGALDVAEGRIRINRETCRSCGTCVKTCPARAMFFYGEEKTVEEVFCELKKDVGYYQRSGGGITVSGGECMLQPEFTSQLLERCREEKIHTVLDTCGYFDGVWLDRIKECVDLVFFDIKLVDPQLHRQYTGVDNALILQNLKEMLRLQMKVVIRVPAIPGITDTSENLHAIAQLVSSLDRSLHIDVLPYHRYGEGKYEMLNLSYPLKAIVPPDDSEKQRYQQLFESYGLDCTVH